MSWTIRNLWHVVRNIVDMVIEARWFLHLILGMRIVMDEVDDLFILAIEINVVHNFIDLLCRCLINIFKGNVTFFRAGRIQVFWAVDGFVDLFWGLKTENVLLANGGMVSLLLLLMLSRWISTDLLPFVRDLVLATLAVRAWSETQVLIFHLWVFFLLGDCLLYLLPKFRVLGILALFRLCLGWCPLPFLLLNLLLGLFIWILLLQFLLFLLFFVFLLVIGVHFVDLSSDLSSNGLHGVYVDIRELLHQHWGVETVTVVYTLPSLSALQLVNCHDLGIGDIFNDSTSVIITWAQFT